MAPSRTSTAPRADTGFFVGQLRQLVILTQAQFAEKLGVSVPTIACWNNNRSQPSPLVLMQLKTMLYGSKSRPLASAELRSSPTCRILL